MKQNINEFYGVNNMGNKYAPAIICLVFDIIDSTKALNNDSTNIEETLTFFYFRILVLI